MSICTPALATKPIPICIDHIEIGDVTANQAVTVYRKDITLNQTFVFQETSSPTGRVIIDTTGFEFSDKHSYELWVTPAAQPITDYMDITVAGETNPIHVIKLSFSPLLQNGEQFGYSIITLQAV